MKTLTGTVAVGGRTFRIEAIPNPARGTWIAAAGEGSNPARWSRLGDGFDTADEALAAAAGGVLRLLSTEVPAKGRDGCVAARRSTPRATSQGEGRRFVPVAFVHPGGSASVAQTIDPRAADRRREHPVRHGFS